MSIKMTLVRNAYKAKLVLSKYSPEILTATGIILGVGATVTAAVATTKLEAVQEQRDANIEKIEKARNIVVNHPEEGMEYTDNEEAADRQIVAMQTVVAYGKLYAPTVILTGLSIASILSAHNIMSKRYTAVATAFAATVAKFNDYRQHVIADHGEVVDQEYINAVEHPVVEGKKGKKVETKDNSKDTVVGPQERFFDEFSPYFDRNNPDLNVAQLRTALTQAQNKLDYQGHLFLNEVYDMLGMSHTPAGAVMGWINDGDGPDEVVDFGIFNGNDDPWDFKNDQPWDGRMGILLHFNANELIYDRI